MNKFRRTIVVVSAALLAAAGINAWPQNRAEAALVQLTLLDWNAAGDAGQGYSADRTTAGQDTLQGRCARGRSMLGGWPPPPGGLGGTRFGCGLATSSR